MSRRAIHYPPALTPVLYLTGAIVAVQAWHAGHAVVAILCLPPLMYVGHMMLITFHEAAHYHLSAKRWFNEARGVVLGIFAFVPLSVYRHVHQFHHARLASEQDAELWPYSRPSVPRWLRVVAAATELTLSWPFTQLQFLLGTFASGRLTKAMRRRIALEYGAMAIGWAFAIAIIAHYGWWEEFFIGYAVPMLGAFNIHAWRKFVEHMGLRSNSPTAAARCIVPRQPLGKLQSAMLLNVNYHSTHHRNGNLHFHELAEATPRVHAADPDALPVFPSYRAALLDMLPTLADPRVGSQWQSNRH
jgi:fatty acid desaturase